MRVRLAWYQSTSKKTRVFGAAAAVEFAPLGPEEAARWLAERGLEPDATARTLAELYARTEGRATVPQVTRRVGF